LTLLNGCPSFLSAAFPRDWVSPDDTIKQVCYQELNYLVIRSVSDSYQIVLIYIHVLNSPVNVAKNQVERMLTSWKKYVIMGLKKFGLYGIYY